MLRKDKEPRIEKLQKLFREHAFTFLVDFSGSSVTEINAFKSMIRENSADFVVAKNTLARIALARILNGGFDEKIASQFTRSTGLIYGSDDIGACAKAMQKYYRSHKDKFRLKAIIYDRKLYLSDDFRKFTELFSTDEIRARLLGLLKSPQTRFVRLLRSVPQSFAGVVKSYIDSKSE